MIRGERGQTGANANASTVTSGIKKSSTGRKAGRMTIMESMVTSLHKPKKANEAAATQAKAQAQAEAEAAKTLLQVNEQNKSNQLILRGPAQANLLSLLRTSKLIIRIRELLLQSSETSHIHSNNNNSYDDDLTDIQSIVTISANLSNVITSKIIGMYMYLLSFSMVL